MESYQSTSVIALGLVLLRNHGLELLDGDALCRLSQRQRALCQDITLKVEPREVEGHEQRGRLGLGDLVREEVGDGFGNLLGADLCVHGPELGQQRFEIDPRQGFLLGRRL
jgi:hypothetical protein